LIRLCAVAALSEDWEEAYTHAKRAHQDRTSVRLQDSLYLHYEVEALLRVGDERSTREEVRRFAERAEVNERERVAYLCSLADLSEWEGDTQGALDHLQEAHTGREDRTAGGTLADPEQAWRYSRAARGGRGGEGGVLPGGANLENARGKIRDEKLRETFISAPQPRRVLGRTN
jgi:hypothetical protein